MHCGVTMETLPDQVPVVPVENYPNPIPEENATRLSTYLYTCRIKMNCQCKENITRTEEKTAITEYQCTCYELTAGEFLCGPVSFGRIVNFYAMPLNNITMDNMMINITFFK